MVQPATFNPLASPQWHRVADWRPRLSDDATVKRLWLRGERWHVLRTPGGIACRLNGAAYEVAGRLDGRRTLQQIWTLLEHHADEYRRDDPPSQDDIVAVVTQLQQHGLLAFDAPAADRSPALTPLQIDAPSSRADNPPRANSLLAWRLPLWDPHRLLTAWAPLGRALFSPTGAVLWGLLFMALLAGLVLHGAALKAHAHTWITTPRYLLLAALVYPLIKAWHELAHGLAVQRWGGEVREAGITLMLLMPIPYVDASAAHGFTRARQRALVSAAGILAELALAAVGLWAWRLSSPGLLQDLGFVVWFTAGVSTLLFNANPLQRLDGYHVMTDALELPNLALRSRQWWGQRLRRWLAPQPGPVSDDLTETPGERPWLIAYAPLAWIFQLALWTGLTWWFGGVSAPLGALVGLLATWQLLMAPAVRGMRLAWHSVLLAGTGSGRAATPRYRAAALLALPLLALLLPWPDARMAQGVVWAPEQALVRPEVDGFVQTVHRIDGSEVRQGDLIITLDNPRLRAEREQAQARLAQAEQNQFGHMGLDNAKAGQASDEVERLGARLAHLDEQQAHLEVRAQRAGRVVLPQAQDLRGRYLKRGNLLGHVMPPGERTVYRLAVPEQDMQDLAQPLKRVAVQSADLSQAPQAAVLLRGGGGAGLQLPSPALSREMGGDIATDPADTSHLKALRPVVLVDVQSVKAASQSPPLGARVWVRFDQGWSPPVAQLWRWLRHRIGERFSPSR